MHMDEKVRELIKPFKDWDVAQLSFGTLMTTIDAIIESKNEKLKDELIAKIQKLQMEKEFTPKNDHDTEDEEVRNEIEKEINSQLYTKEDGEKENIEESKNLGIEFKRSITDLLTHKFPSELKTLTDTEYYKDVKWFVNLPSYTTKTNTVSSSFHDYCRALRKKVATLINSVNNDPNSNAFYITRRKVDVNTVIPTMLLFDPKAFDIRRIVRFEDPNDDYDIKLIIADSNEDDHIIKLKYHRGYSIIECDNGNPNFMLFDPVNCEYVLFYKSHKLLYASCDARNVKNERVRHYKSKVCEELCHPEDISDQYRKPKVPILLEANVTNPFVIKEKQKKTINKHPYSKITSISVDDVRKELEKDRVDQLSLLVGKNYDTYKNNYTITIPDSFKHFKHILRQRIKKLIKDSSENKIIVFNLFKNEDNYNTFCLNTLFSYKPKSYSIDTDINYYKDSYYCDRYRLTLYSKDRSDIFDLKYHEDCTIVHGNDSNYNFMIYDPLTKEYTLFVNSETMEEENY